MLENLEINKFPQAITPYFFASLFIMTIIAVYVSAIGAAVERLGGKEPNKFLYWHIKVVDSVNTFLKQNIGIHWRTAAPYIFTLIFFILFANISGIFGLITPTAFTAITVPLTLFSLYCKHQIGLKSRKIKHFKGLFEPVSIMFPINLLSEFTPILSMSFRLFGNIVSGGILLSLVYSLLGGLSPFVTPIMHFIFDILFGCIQTLVFVLLTVIAISQKTEDTDKYENTDENFLLEYNLVYKNAKN